VPKGAPSFVLLTDKEAALIEDTFDGLRQMCKEHPTKKFEEKCLMPGKWMNDAVIGQLEEVYTKTVANDTVLLHPFYGGSGVSNEVVYPRIVGTLTRILEKRKKGGLGCPRTILVPINDGNAHWCLLYFNASNRVVYWFDSLATNLKEFHYSREADIRLALQDAGYNGFCELPASSVFPACPQQTNTIDCGVFVCTFLRLIVDNCIDLIPKLSSLDMDWCRMMIYTEVNLKRRLDLLYCR
jgi:Ulp1 family protease